MQVTRSPMGRLSRREAMGRVAAAGLGVVSVLSSELGSRRAHAQGGPLTPPAAGPMPRA